MLCTLKSYYLSLLINFFADMKLLELVMALGLVPFLAFIVILPESPRWLISKGRVDEAKVILAKALKMNKQPLSRLDELDKIARVDKDSPQKQAFFTDLLKYPGIRRNILLMSFCWFAFSMGYYGLIYNTPSFGWNIYITFCMPGANFINIFSASFSYKHHLGSFFFIHVTR